jgi:hypothetical protein
MDNIRLFSSGSNMIKYVYKPGHTSVCALYFAEFFYRIILFSKTYIFLNWRILENKIVLLKN